MANACGGWDYEPGYDCYHLMGNLYDQMQIDLHNSDGFLPRAINYPSNTQLWQNYLGGNLNEEELNRFIYQSPLDEVTNLLEGKLLKATNTISQAVVEYFLKNGRKEVLKYLQFAKKCEFLADNDSYSWYYEREIDYDSYNDLIEQGAKLIASINDSELRLRYGYQLVRLAHYSDQYQLAQQFFKEYVKPHSAEHQIYFMAYEQIAGVYKKQGKLSQAAYMFSKCYASPMGNKEIAIRSFRFCMGYDGGDTIFQNALKLSRNQAERIILHTIYGSLYGSFSDNTINELYQADPNHPIILNMFYESIFNIENENFGMGQWFAGDKELDFSLELNLLTKIIDERKRKDWRQFAYMKAYVLFITKEFKESRKILGLAKREKDLEYQFKTLTTALNLVELEEVNSKVENEYLQLFQKNDDLRSDEQLQHFWKRTFYGLYEKQNQKARQFFCFNQTNSFENSMDIESMRSSLSFLSKPQLSDFESYLAGNVNGQKQLLLEYMGTYFFRTNQLDSAEFYYVQLAQAFENDVNYRDWRNDSYQFGNSDFYSEEMFYSRSDDWRTGIDAISINDEKWYAAFHSKYNLDVNTKLELVQKMRELEKLAVTSKSNSTKAICYTLLGNLWYNVSGHGFYRRVLNYAGGWHAQYDTYYGWYDYDSDNEYFDFFNDVDFAQECFNNANAYASNKEQKARIAFGLAKCEEAQFISSDNENDYWYNRTIDESLNKSEFEDLKALRETQYVKDVIKECGYFETYLNN